MRRVVIVGSILLSLVCSSQAQTPAETDQEQTIKQLIAEVNDLKARIAVLEAQQAKAEPAVLTTTEPEPAGSATAALPAPPPAGTQETFGLTHGIKLQGFASATFKGSNGTPPEMGASLGFQPGSSADFAVGDVDLFLTSQFSARTSILTEVAFSEQNSGEFETDVERLLLKYDPSDYLKMSFGRFHTGTSYYNSVFHHGSWLQTTVDRPLVVEFSDHGGLLPSQAIGASLTGRIPSGKLGLNYIFEYGSANIIRPQITSPDLPEIEEHNTNEITGGLFFKPDWLPGLDLGGSFYHDHLNPDGINLHLEQSIGSVHAVYNSPRFEFLNEGFIIQHKIQETGQVLNTPAFYSLISHKIGERWRPYFRYQYVNAPAISPVFADVGLRYGPSGGLRFEANDYIAVKLQYDRIFRRSLPDFGDVLAQLAFRF